MAQEFYIVCPKCEHSFNAHKMIYDEGPDYLVYCPSCMQRFARKEGQIESANFQLTD